MPLLRAFNIDTILPAESLVACVLAMTLVALPANGQVTEVVSFSEVTHEEFGGSFHPVPSADGRFVAFISAADDHVQGDTNESTDVFLRDREMGTTTRVSVGSGGMQLDTAPFSERGVDNPSASGTGGEFDISADARFVVFNSSADNLMSEQCYCTPVYVHDRMSGETSLVSFDTEDFRPITGRYPSISADGSLIVFETDDMWVIDREMTRTLLYYTGSGVLTSIPGIESAEISAGGRYIIGRDPQKNDLIILDLEQEENVTISPPPGVEKSVYFASSTTVFAISDDGQYVVFQAMIGDVAFGDGPFLWMWDRETGMSKPIGFDEAGNHMAGADMPEISGDGRYIVFEGKHESIHIYDRELRATWRLDVTVTTGEPAEWRNPNGVRHSTPRSLHPAITSDGKIAVFDSRATNFLENDTNDAADIFLVTLPKAEEGLVVNSTRNRDDHNIGDGLCDTGDKNAASQPECTLRAAVQEANANEDKSVISFSISSLDPGYTGVYTIKLGRALPAIVHPVQIDGTTQPEHSGSPVIVLDGERTIPNEPGVWLRGGKSEIRGLVINNFFEDGIRIDSAGKNVVRGNYIGTNSTGNNRYDGGGALCIDPEATTGNCGSGVHIKESSGNVIGGTDEKDRNIISNNGFSGTTGCGVTIDDNPNEPAVASMNVIQGNYIGANFDGSWALPNNGSGVCIDGASSNTIGGDKLGARNVILANGSHSITIRNGAENNIIQGNLIGIHPRGRAPAQPNMKAGILISLSPGTIVGGLTDSPGSPPGNVITGHGHSDSQQSAGGAIEILRSPSTVIQGNLIGTDLDGDEIPTNDFGLFRGNGGVGILVKSDDVLIGGPNVRARNVISGNTVGIVVAGGAPAEGVAAVPVVFNEIRNNYIGVSAAGDKALGNVSDGIRLEYAASTIVSDNVVSAAGGHGIAIFGTASRRNSVERNRIGVSADGDGALPNALNGLEIHSGENLVNENVVSGNKASGIHVTGKEAVQNEISKNLVGTAGDGETALGNGLHGLHIEMAPSTKIRENVFASNAIDGIQISGATANRNEIHKNAIGTNLDDFIKDAGDVKIGNGRYGILIDGEASEIAVGGPAGALGNYIAYNGLDGVRIRSGQRNAIRSNSIFSNRGLGIDVGFGRGIGISDAQDATGSPNGLQAFPQLNDVRTTSTGDVIVSGSLSSLPNTTYTIEIFSNTECDGSGYGEGEFLPVEESVMTDADGRADFSLELVLGFFNLFTATATDPDGNTSEFSRCVGVEDADAGTPFVVNSIGDMSDRHAGDGKCDTGGSLVDGATECTLRAAVEETNALSGLHRIQFRIPGEAPHVILPGSPLPPLTDAVDVDGGSQPGYSGRPVITLDGRDAGASDGLRLMAPEISVRALQIIRFSGNGIALSGAGGSTIRASIIGTDPNRAEGLGNGGHGILIDAAADVTVGSTSTSQANMIAGNGGDGIRIESGSRIRMVRNAIFLNGGIGIDLEGDGSSANDVDDADQGTNNGQNHPRIATASGSGDLLTVAYRVGSSASHAAYPLDVEFFLSAEGQGSVYLGTVTYESHIAGTERVVSFAPEVALESGASIVGTATDADGNTSEFGNSVTIEGSVSTAVPKDERILPARIVLEPNYPNPFNPRTIIGYEVPKAGHVRLRVFDLLGREIAELVNDRQAAGRYNVEFDASSFPSGSYAYVLETEATRIARMMFVTK